MWLRGSKVRSTSKNVARDHALPLLCAGPLIQAPDPAIAKYVCLPAMWPFFVAGQSSSTVRLLKMPRSESHQQPSVPRPRGHRNGHQLNFSVDVSPVASLGDQANVVAPEYDLSLPGLRTPASVKPAAENLYGHSVQFHIRARARILPGSSDPPHQPQSPAREPHPDRGSCRLCRHRAPLSLQLFRWPIPSQRSATRNHPTTRLPVAIFRSSERIRLLI